MGRHRDPRLHRTSCGARCKLRRRATGRDCAPDLSLLARNAPHSTRRAIFFASVVLFVYVLCVCVCLLVIARAVAVPRQLFLAMCFFFCAVAMFLLLLPVPVYFPVLLFSFFCDCIIFSFLFFCDRPLVCTILLCCFSVTCFSLYGPPVSGCLSLGDSESLGARRRRGGAGARRRAPALGVASRLGYL